jgi:prepilin-type N-terminal cleavage/methylation domain-containing protein
MSDTSSTTKAMKNNERGFSLIELLIVVVIIGVIASIAASFFFASKRSANEGSSLSSMRLLHSAQVTYSQGVGAGEYAGDTGAGTLTGLTMLNSAGLIDGGLASGSKSGYVLVTGREASTPGAAAQFFVSAIPATSGAVFGTGVQRLGIATDGIIKSDTTDTVHYADVNEVIAAPPRNN